MTLDGPKSKVNGSGITKKEREHTRWLTKCGYNPFRDELGGEPYQLDHTGQVLPLEGPGIGIDVDEKFLASHPLIDGPCYV